jgi:hypothetical protein
VRWGFDGSVQDERFNPLSVLMVNPSPEPFEGAVRLVDGLALAANGVSWSQSVFLAPGGSRWLQFGPWVRPGASNWTLTWPGGAFQIEDPRHGRPATVALDPSGDGGASASFPAELFPVTVALTDGLGRLVLDHAPRWSPEQRRACAGWVRRGGELHLAAGPDGRLPALGGELAALDADAGAGRVVRHQRPRHAVLTGLPAEAPVGEEQPHHNRVEAVQRAFGGLTQADPAWGWIFLVLISFLLLAGPGLRWLGRRRPWWVVQGVLLALVAATTVLMAMIGRRGFGESEITHLGVVAEDLGDGGWDATWFGATFVTGSRELGLRPPVQGRALFACPDQERVAGRVLDADGGRLAAAVPLFSVLHWCARGRAAAALPSPVVRVQPLAGGLLEAHITFPGGWPAVHGVAVAHAGRLFACVPAAEGGWKLTVDQKGEELAKLSTPWDSPTRDPAVAYERVQRALTGHALERPPAAGRLALLVAVDLPPALHLPAGSVPGRQEGRLLLRRDLPVD